MCVKVNNRSLETWIIPRLADSFRATLITWKTQYSLRELFTKLLHFWPSCWRVPCSDFEFFGGYSGNFTLQVPKWADCPISIMLFDFATFKVTETVSEFSKFFQKLIWIHVLFAPEAVESSAICAEIKPITWPNWNFFYLEFFLKPTRISKCSLIASPNMRSLTGGVWQSWIQILELLASEMTLLPWDHAISKSKNHSHSHFSSWIPSLQSLP